jgi:hypothetical protein
MHKMHLQNSAIIPAWRLIALPANRCDPLTLLIVRQVTVKADGDEDGPTKRVIMEGQVGSIDKAINMLSQTLALWASTSPEHAGMSTPAQVNRISNRAPPHRTEFSLEFPSPPTEMAILESAGQSVKKSNASRSLPAVGRASSFPGDAPVAKKSRLLLGGCHGTHPEAVIVFKRCNQHWWWREQYAS